MDTNLIVFLWRFFWGIWLFLALFAMFLILIKISEHNRKLNWQKVGICGRYKPYWPIDKALVILIGISLISIQLFSSEKYPIIIPIVMLLASFVITITRMINNNWRYFRGY